MIIDTIINPEAGANSHIWYRAPIYRTDDNIVVELSRGRQRNQPYEMAEWLACPDWHLMTADPGGNYWACQHGVAFRRPGQAPAMHDWNAGNEHYANPADHRSAAEFRAQGLAAEHLATAAFAEGYGRDARQVAPALDLLAVNELAAMARLGVGLYRQAYLWALGMEDLELCRWLLGRCPMAEAMAQMAGVAR